MFKALDLPTPQSGEFRIGCGNLGIVFLHQAGCVLRIVENKVFQPYRHPNLMRPIGSVKIDDNIRLDIQFTGSSPVSKHEAKNIYSLFKKSGLKVRDVHQDNFCYLRLQNASFPQDTPIMFDPSKVALLSKSIRWTKAILGGVSVGPSPRLFKWTGPIIDYAPQKDEIPDNQDIAFEDLRTRFKDMFSAAAIAEGRIETIPEAVDSFWQSMMKATVDGRLKPKWMERGSRSDCYKVSKNSRAYAKSLGQTNSLFMNSEHSPA